MTLQEKKEEAKKLKKDDQFNKAVNLFKEIWEEERTDWNGYFLALCYRKTEKFDEALLIHKAIQKEFPYFKAIVNEKLWLDYSTKIKNWDNKDYLTDAEKIIALSDQYDTYSGKVFIKTILAVARRLSNRAEIKLEWLKKLDQSILDNKVFRFNDIAYPADRKTFFIEYADALILLGKHTDYIEEKLASLNFQGMKHTQFLKYIVESYTFPHYKHNTTIISRTRLALHIKNFQEEIHLRKEATVPTHYLPDKKTSVSDLSHYLFCPVSFAINETFEIYANTSWERDEWKHDKLYMADRHKRYQEKLQVSDALKDTLIELNPEVIKQFKFIFESELLINNASGPKPVIHENTQKSLLGAPDYVLKHPNGLKFIVTEKFSYLNAKDFDKPFDSDLIKPVAFLNSFSQLELNFGLIVNWFWTFEDVDPSADVPKKKIVIRAYKIHKVEKAIGLDKFEDVLGLVNSLKKNKKMNIDGNSVAYPNKCLHCSVVSYCHHKTGRWNEISLPYPLRYPAD
jgi:hypothetical protein